MTMDKENKDILYVLVIYGCRVEDSEAFRTLIAPYSGEIRNTFVYDNSRQVQATEYNVAEYIHDTGNGGLGKAYNEAGRFASRNGYKWMLLLDQDTRFPKGALSCYKKAAAVAPAQMVVPRHKVSNGKYLSPTPYFMKSSDLCDQAPAGLVRFKECAPINSGMMLTVESFNKAGGYDERVWLDFSDICFVEKYKKHYAFFYVMPEVTCVQSYSGLDDNSTNIYKRFCIYLECARNYPKHLLADHISLLITTLRPTVSRTIKEHTLKYAKAYFNIYVLAKKWNYDGNEK